MASPYGAGGASAVRALRPRAPSTGVGLAARTPAARPPCDAPSRMRSKLPTVANGARPRFAGRELPSPEAPIAVPCVTSRHAAASPNPAAASLAVLVRIARPRVLTPVPRPRPVVLRLSGVPARGLEGPLGAARGGPQPRPTRLLPIKGVRRALPRRRRLLRRRALTRAPRAAVTSVPPASALPPR